MSRNNQQILSKIASFAKGSVLVVLGLCGSLIIYLAIFYSDGQSVVIPGNGYELSGRIYGSAKSAKPKAATIFLVGWSPGGAPWTPSQYFAARLARETDMACIVVALRGMGSPGNITNLTRQDFLDDAMAAYDFVTTMAGIDNRQIYLEGESFGGYLASCLSAKRPVRGISLRVPTDFPAAGFSTVPQIQLAGNATRSWKAAQHGVTESPSLQALHNFTGNILIVWSEFDQMVPRQTTMNYLNAVSNSMHCTQIEMKNLDHSLMNPFRVLEYYNILRSWFSSI